MPETEQAIPGHDAGELAYQVTTARERVEMIARTDWAQELDWADVIRVSQFFDACSVKKGTVLFREGDTDVYLSLVVEGSLDVIKTSCRTEEETRLATLGQGMTIGELSILDGQPRSATVIASSDAKLLILTAENFARLCEECPRLILQMVLRMMRQISQRLRDTSGQLAEYLQ